MRLITNKVSNEYYNEADNVNSISLYVPKDTIIYANTTINLNLNVQLAHYYPFETYIITNSRNINTAPIRLSSNLIVINNNCNTEFIRISGNTYEISNLDIDITNITNTDYLLKKEQKLAIYTKVILKILM